MIDWSDVKPGKGSDFIIDLSICANARNNVGNYNYDYVGIYVLRLDLQNYRKRNF